MDDISKILEGKNIPEQRRICKALGVEFKHPSVSSQVLNRGNIQKRHRGRAKDDSPFVVIPEIHLSSGRVIPEVMIDPAAARATALELLRIANQEGF